MRFYSRLRKKKIEGERGSNLTCSEFQFYMKTRGKIAFWNTWWEERYSYGCMLWSPACVCVWETVNIISNRDAYCRVKFKGCTLPFLCFWSVLRDGYWSASRHMTVQGGLIGEAHSPKRCQVSDSEQMLTNRNKKHTRGTLHCCLCVHPSLRRVRMAGIELRRGRTSSHGHLPVHDASQKTDKAKLLFILQLQCKWSSLLSLFTPDLLTVHILLFTVSLHHPLSLSLSPLLPLV